MSVPLVLVGTTLHPQDNHTEWFFTMWSSPGTKAGGEVTSLESPSWAAGGLGLYLTRST